MRGSHDTCTPFIITFFLPILSQTMPQKRLPENEPTNTTCQKIYMFCTIRIINYQFFTQVTIKKIATKLGIVLIAVTLSGWSSYPKSRALKEALRYPLVKCLCYWVLQEFPQGKACVCHFEFTCSGWSGATTYQDRYTAHLFARVGTSAVGTMLFGSWHTSSTVPVGTQ